MTSSDYVLPLVRQALDEFDDRPLEVSVRRAVRIASLVGDSRTAVRLGYELRPLGGDRRANAADVKRARCTDINSARVTDKKSAFPLTSSPRSTSVRHGPDSARQDIRF
ncbi:MAG TPA: hypothetical protein VMV92_29390 [Streptosporangiaceae bacterium]|nr:hypothetical protein [Streptosporangiaceae bacterium]